MRNGAVRNMSCLGIGFLIASTCFGLICRAPRCFRVGGCRSVYKTLGSTAYCVNAGTPILGAR